MTTAQQHRPGSGAETGQGWAQVYLRLRSAQKPPAAGSPAYSRFVNRRLGRVLAAACYRVGLSPDQVSWISAGFSAGGIALLALARPTPTISLLVTAALVVGYAFDSADGQLARLLGGGRPAGEWLDHVIDSVKVTALHLAVLVGWYRFTAPAGLLLVVPLGFTLTSSTLFFSMWITDAMRRAHLGGAGRPSADGRAAVLRSLAVVPTDYGLLALSFLLWWRADLFALLYGLLFAGTTAFLVAALPRWFREVSRFADPGRGQGPSAGEAS